MTVTAQQVVVRPAVTAHQVDYDQATGLAHCLYCDWRGVPVIDDGYVMCPVGTAEETDQLYDELTKPRRVEQLPGRNDPCHCGSGRKFKKCHGS